MLKANARMRAVQAVVLADSAVELCMKPWGAVSSYCPIGGDINLAVVEALRSLGIGIPYPQREVRMLSAA